MSNLSFIKYIKIGSFLEIKISNQYMVQRKIYFEIQNIKNINGSEFLKILKYYFVWQIHRIIYLIKY